jgi:hypothetical protein
VVDVILVRTSDQTEQKLQARVVHARLLPEGLWLLGCSFVSPLSEEQRQTFL